MNITDQIFVENPVNNGAFQQTRKTKRDEGSTRGNGPQACKRAALGTITNNGGRIQPSRAAKGQVLGCGVGSENIPPNFHQVSQTKSSGNSFSFSNQSRPAFVIHQDTQSKKETNLQPQRDPDVEILSIHPAVTTLPHPFTEFRGTENIEPSSEPSPMVLDSSLNDSRLTDTGVINIDNGDDLYLVSEYAEDVFEYLREAETRNRPKPSYMKKQPDITTNMRCILVDWLVEVAEEYKLKNETLYLAVNYIDRFLSQMSVFRSKLQLVGTAGMFVASKFEEIYPPELKDFVYITDDTYTPKQVLCMETLMLKVLSFDLSIPTTNVFLARFIQASQTDSKVEHLAQYLSELTLMDFDFTKYLPSTIAASAVCLARHTLHNCPWSSTLTKYSQYELSDILPCVAHIHKVFTEASKHQQQAIREKYKSHKYNSISLTQPRENPPSIC